MANSQSFPNPAPWCLFCSQHSLLWKKKSCYEINVFKQAGFQWTSVCSGRVRAPLDLGRRWPYCPPQKNHNARKHELYKRTQIAVKTKTLPILKSNERVIIPKSQLNPNFSNFRGKRTLVQNIRYFEKSGVTKITVFDWGEGNDFRFALSGGRRKRWRFEKSGFHCSYFSWNLAYFLTTIDS